MTVTFSTTRSPGLCVLWIDTHGVPSSEYPQELHSTLQTFSWKKGTSHYCRLSDGQEMLLIGTGTTPKDALDAQTLGGLLYQALCSVKTQNITVRCDTFSNEITRAIGLGFLLRSWRFTKYHTAFRPLSEIPEHPLVIVHPEADLIATAFEQERCLADCIGWTRNLVNEPANILFPKAFVEHLQPLTEFGIEIEILDRARLEQMGCGALLGVAQGSQHAPYMAILHWRGGGEKAPIAFVGKGVTFDSGGISIKPANGMEEMKMDMTGAAVVCGLLRRLSKRKARVNAVGVVALVENMPSGSAQRPGDIVTSLSGQTIEVLNTDAEGRLILADALWMTQERFKPSVMVDLATLTGAVRVALGPEFAGLFSNCDTLAEALLSAGTASGEKLWRLPLCEGYDKAINGAICDLANIAPPGYGAGSSTAAQFLQRFTNNVPWAHLDIASVDHLSKDTTVFAKGGMAFGLALLDTWIRDHEHPS